MGRQVGAGTGNWFTGGVDTGRALDGSDPEAGGSDGAFSVSGTSGLSA
jgi:hypothetical protein